MGELAGSFEGSAVRGRPGCSEYFRLGPAAAANARTHQAKRHMAKRVMFLGHFGMGNFGNESTLQAMLCQLRTRLPDARFACICTGPATAALTHHIATMPISRTIGNGSKYHGGIRKAVRSVFIGLPRELYRWLEGFAILKGTDVMIVPGTGLLTDAFGVTGWGPYSTFKWSLLAKMRGCKLLFVSVGAGPIYRTISRRLVKITLALADFRSYRDQPSMQYLNSIGFMAADDRVYPDLAFSLPDALFPQDGGRRPRLVVGLGLMEYAGRYSVEHPSSVTYKNYLENLVVFARWLLSRGCDIRLLTGDLSDRRVVTEFVSLLKEHVAESEAERIIDQPIDSVQELAAQLSQTDLVVATRFHNILLALLDQKPVVAISFHHKCESLMSGMGLSDYCLNINSLRSGDLIERFCDLEKNAPALRKMIRRHIDKCRAALEEQYELLCSKV